MMQSSIIMGSRYFSVAVSLVAAVGLTAAFGVTSASAQAGMRASLERLDVNENEWIEPNEVTPLSRPFLERIARYRRIDFDEPNHIDRWLEAAQRYYATQNGADDRNVRPESESTVRTFGPDDGQPLIPEFGLPEVKFAYTQDDLDFAERTLRSHDWNRDGYIDRTEAEYNEWTHRPPFEDDLDKDDRLSRLELAQRYARRRLLEDASDEIRRREWRIESSERYTERMQRENERREPSWSQRGGTDYWLTSSVLERFDSNRNGRLEADETEELGMPISQIDLDRDGELTREELFGYLKEVQDELATYDQGLPGWFYELDADQDGQIKMSEFASDWTAEKIEEFDGHDINGDGLITSEELADSIANVGGSFWNHSAEVIPPRKTIISEIEIDEDFLIRDLNVQISLTHTHISWLDGFLTGPDGQRIELFAGVGGSGDHFPETTFDDQSGDLINKSRPPFTRSYRPSGLDKRQPGLSAFNETNAKGVWQLVIRGTRNERFGMLHNWRLIFQPIEE